MSSTNTCTFDSISSGNSLTWTIKKGWAKDRPLWIFWNDFASFWGLTFHQNLLCSLIWECNYPMESAVSNTGVLKFVEKFLLGNYIKIFCKIEKKMTVWQLSSSSSDMSCAIAIIILSNFPKSSIDNTKSYKIRLQE